MATAGSVEKALCKEMPVLCWRPRSCKVRAAD